MIQKLCLLTCHNLYESKQYFTEKLAEAFQRKGVETKVLRWQHGPIPAELIQQIEGYQPDLTCSFHQLPPQSYFWEHLKQPHWTILVDPAFYDLELMQSPFSILSCVDRYDCELLHSYHFERCFFWPHAVERELFAEVNSDRPIPVILLGTCYDPDHLRAFWQKKYPREVSRALDDAAEIVLTDRTSSFFRALMRSLTLHEIDPHEVEFDQLAYYVDSYTRGIDRIQLVRAIQELPVHVFGGKCWREEQPIADWSYYLAKQSNVTIHPAVPFEQALELLKRSRFCLNSMPFFKDGSHERVFAALACGALPITSENRYMRELFDGDLLFYDFSQLHALKLQVVDEERRQQMVAKGQAKVRAGHTWDARVETAIHELELIKIKT